MTAGVHEPQFLTAGEIADLFRVSRGTVWRWGREGVIRQLKIGGTLRYHAADVRRLVAGDAA